MLQANCSADFGIRKVDEITFINDFDNLSHLLAVVSEFIIILREEEQFPMESMVDVTEALTRIAPEGTYIDEENFSGLLTSLQTTEKLVKFFNRKHEEYPETYGISKEVPVFDFLITEIKRVFDENGEVKDNASPELQKIREKIRKTQSGISVQIDRLLKRAKADGVVATDTQPSIRDGRLVIPIEARNKRKVNGIIHDESATGKTAYIEPAEVVEAHNKLKTYHHEEKREVVKILIALTNHVRPYTKEIIESFEFLGFVDINRSKAKVARILNAICPKIKNDTIIDWRKATHPILYLNHKKENKAVVPLDIHLDKKNRILVISGPNAGGKSVCLKTVGLLQYMVQCGLPIPIDESSEMGIFQRIFMDIGDEQSIDNDLSTYSSHLMNMKHFLRYSNGRTLLLVDEFGTGTEPKLGGSIAESILESLNDKKAFGVINTHYGNLKHFATETDGVVNGAMLFDIHLMQPLYKLEIGKPGSSYAIEIARKIGIPDEVIKSASDKIGEEHFQYDKHLREIGRDKKYWEEKRNNIRLKDKQLSKTIETLEAEKERLNAERKAILAKAKEEAEKIYRDANARIEKTIREIKENQADKEATKKAREKLEAQKEHMERMGKKDMRISRKAHHLIKQQEKKTPGPSKKKSNTLSDIIEVGNVVRLEGQTGTGEVLSIKGKEAEVAFGLIRSKIKLDKLEKVSNKQRKREISVNVTHAAVSSAFSERKQNFRHEIDVRGQRADEAMHSITDFMDTALMVRAKQVRILHGTGTGALREMTRQYLKTLSFVDSYSDERVDMGGSGITVVNLDV